MRLRTLTNHALHTLLASTVVQVLLADEDEEAALLGDVRALDRLHREFLRRQWRRELDLECVCEDCCRWFPEALDEPPAGAPS